MRTCLLILVSFTASSIYAQKAIDVMIYCSCYFGFEDTSDFEYIKIDTNNVWKINKNQKELLNYDNNAIISDTNLYYAENLESSFQFKLHLEHCCDAFWITFKHKYDFENNRDGGIIETSYDNGITWQNIVNDTIINIRDTYGLYNISDSIKSYNNQPGYTGQQLLVSEVGIQFGIDMSIDTMLLRFTISSDTNFTNNEGWILDDFSFGELMVGIEENTKQNDISIIPNPSHDIVTVDSPSESIKKIEVLNISSIKILEKLNTNSIDISGLKPGIYILRINEKFNKKVLIE